MPVNPLFSKGKCMSRFIMLLVLASCGTEITDRTPPIRMPKPKQVAVAPKPPEIVFDTTFTPESGIRLWESEVSAAVDALLAAPDPVKTEETYAAFFKVTDSSAYRMLTDDGQEGYSYHWPDSAGTPTIESAKTLEARDEEYEAGLQYLVLGDKKAVSRCVKALKSEGEWAAVAVLALELDDDAVLDEAMSKVDGSAVDNIVERALESKDFRQADRLASKYGVSFDHWQFQELLKESGNPKYLADLIEKQIKPWPYISAWQVELGLIPATGVLYEVCQSEPEEGSVSVCAPDLTLMVKLARADRKAALGFAKRFLSSPRSNVAVDGSIDLYKIIKSEPDLKELYLRQTRAWSVDFPNLKFLREIREADEPELLAIWKTYVNDFAPKMSTVASAELRSERIPYFLACRSDRRNYQIPVELDKCLSWEEHVRGFALAKQLLGMPNGSLAYVDPFVYGDISTDEINRLWKEFKLPVPDPNGPKYTTEAEQQEALKTMEAFGKWPTYNPVEADTIHVALIQSGYNDDNYIQWMSSGRRESDGGKAIDYALLQAGYSSSARRTLVDAIQQRVIADWDVLTQAGAKLSQLLEQPFVSATENAKQTQTVAQWGLPTKPVHPNTDAEAIAIIAKVLPILDGRVIEQHDTILVSLAMHGDRSFYEAELSSRNTAGDLSGVQRLTDLMTRATAVVSR